MVEFYLGVQNLGGLLLARLATGKLLISFKIFEITLRSSARLLFLHRSLYFRIIRSNMNGSTQPKPLVKATNE